MGIVLITELLLSLITETLELFAFATYTSWVYGLNPSDIGPVPTPIVAKMPMVVDKELLVVDVGLVLEEEIVEELRTEDEVE